MNPFEMIFVPGGRLSRLPYFLAGLALTFGTLVVVVLAVTTGIAIGARAFSTQGAGGQNAAAVIVVVLIMLVALCAYLYGTVNLTVKRLHDLDMSGLHSIWIYGLGFVGSVFQHLQTPLGLVAYLLCTLASFGVGLALLFMPGVDVANEYGHVFE